MAKLQKVTTFVSDFETTVTGDVDQDETEVWSAGLVELGTENCIIFNSIDKWWNYLIKVVKGNIKIYFHNLKFDGSFILDYFERHLKLEQAFEDCDGVKTKIKRQFMKPKSYNYAITEMGQWYMITIHINGRYIDIVDSLKLLPFSVKTIGKAFKTKHQKLEMEYVGDRHANETITPEEQEYLKNDLLVVKEALEIMFEQGHAGLTIGSCCVKEYKTTIMDADYKTWFPNMGEIELNKDEYGSEDADLYIRKAYRGGWCYVVPEMTDKLIENGVTADVNSLYPSQMHSESGNYYPIGKPVFWKGDYIPEVAQRKDMIYFVRIRTRFKIRDGYLPFIQVKNSLEYKSNECLTTSDVKGKDGKYYDHFSDGRPCIMTMTLTEMDFELIKKHYILYDTTILDGCYFVAMKGIFDEYINKWRKVKETSKGAIRTIAKLFLNNLYGKLSTSRDSSFKTVTFDDEDERLHFEFNSEMDKKLFYIPCGACITSYARRFTITSAQENYHPETGRGFIYSDTDSIHCNLRPEEVKGIKVHPTAFNCWKLESTWDKAIFVRQKTYVEHITQEDLEDVTPYWNVKCAGMPDRCKKIFLESIGEKTDLKDLDENEKDYIKKSRKAKRDITAFKAGLVVPSKLMAHRVKGGIVLVKTDMEIRE